MEILWHKCLNVKENESVLIITDSKLYKLGMIFFSEAQKLTNNAKLIMVPIPKTHGTEPPENISYEMLKYNVILMPTTKSLTHTKATKMACKNGARVASMPGITEDMIKRALNVDFNKVINSNKKLICELKNKSVVRITTKEGTDVEFYLKGRKWKSDDGVYTKKGDCGNLPAGEIFIAPLEGKTNGTVIVDASVGGLGKVDKKIEIKIKNGIIEHIKGGKTAKAFNDLLKNELYKSVAELGIGTNYKAKITGNVLEDEKVAGTCHIAFGNNKYFGGKIDIPFHVDVVIKKPEII